MTLKLLSLFLALNFIVTFFIIIKHWIFFFFYFVLLLRISKSNLPKKEVEAVCERERERAMGACTSKPEGCVKGRIKLPKKRRNCRKRRRGSKRHVSFNDNLQFENNVDRSHFNPAFQIQGRHSHSFHSFKYWFIELINIYCDENQEA